MVEIKNGGSPLAQLWYGVREESEMNGRMDGEGGGVRKNLSEKYKFGGWQERHRVASEKNRGNKSMRA